jgi:hypothetical protein
MSSGGSGWQGLAPQDVQQASPDVRNAMANLKGRVPIATVTLQVYSTQKGDSTATVQLSPDGPFAQVMGTSPALNAIILRELQSALAALGSVD